MDTVSGNGQSTVHFRTVAKIQTFSKFRITHYTIISYRTPCGIGTLRALYICENIDCAGIEGKVKKDADEEL